MGLMGAFFICRVLESGSRSLYACQCHIPNADPTVTPSRTRSSESAFADHAALTDLPVGQPTSFLPTLSVFGPPPTPGRAGHSTVTVTVTNVTVT
jgi:hypothetical protein